MTTERGPIKMALRFMGSTISFKMNIEHTHGETKIERVTTTNAKNNNSNDNHDHDHDDNRKYERVCMYVH